VGGSGGAAGDAGQGGAGEAGTGGGCGSPTTYYRDEDGDGFGDKNQTTTACAPPAGWTAEAGDCNDKNKDVFPGQTMYFGVGYSKTGAPGGISFDYDCNSSEEVIPGVATAPDCKALAGLGCPENQNGYVPTARSGSGISALCGSNILTGCKKETLSCSTISKGVGDPVKCR
jgi:hypothetical protein